MSKTTIAVIIILVVIVGGYFLLKSGVVQAPGGEVEGTPTMGMPVPGTNTPEMIVETEPKNMVTYTDDGYLPATLRVKLGEKVTWVNESSFGMWTASASHPSHMMYAGTTLEEHCPDTLGTAFDVCTSIQPGGSWNFTFNKAGEWKYHNHVHGGHFGTVIVE